MALSSFQHDYFTDHELLNYFNFNYDYLPSDPLLEFEESFCSAQHNLISPNLPHIFPSPHEFNPNKRHKTIHSDFEYIQTPDIPAQLPKFERSGEASHDNVKKQSRGSSSAQSVAARERRRKITDKTQELGKLIPGGTKMNTAQMLSSAFNYVKFLQAQLQLLQLMQEEVLQTNEMKILVGSSKVQEILCSEKKCLVPTEFLLNVVNDKAIRSHPFIVDEIYMLLGTNS
ncbi:basic helix-loop-helix (bHLH) DNA-binding superfamily protein [Euphorbia peplus]|nr:basic helix-loop-helix (bHLH) DNA-binding superfamily protein [Euphorbia peplus]